MMKEGVMSAFEPCLLDCLSFYKLRMTLAPLVYSYIISDAFKNL